MFGHQWQPIRGMVDSRATRVGEFSPNGGFFILGSFVKIEEVAHMFELLISTV
jgi:hypothetical protein